MNIRSLLTLAILLPLPFAAFGEDLAGQSAELAPIKTKDGVRFQVEAPGAEKVFLAGTFNNWADNKDGEVKDANYAMQENEDIWTRYVALDRGVYFLKFVVEKGGHQAWTTPAYWVSRDHADNAKLWITGEGNPYLHRLDSAKHATQKKPGEVTFSLVAPGLDAVYVAGDFNNWANNKDGLVSSKDFAMEGPDEDGVWKLTLNLAPGSHAYQFVLDGDTWIQDPNQEGEDAELHSIIKTE